MAKESITFRLDTNFWNRVGIALKLIIYNEVSFSTAAFKKLIKMIMKLSKN